MQTQTWNRLGRAAAALLLAGCGGRAGTGAASGAATPAGAAVTLFDGRTLDGWRQVGQGRFVAQPDGSLRSEGGKGVLYHTRPYGDFVLDVDWKVDDPRADAGVHLRADSARAGAGYQVQIRDSSAVGIYERSQRMTGAIDSVAAATHPAGKPAGEWNHYRIEAAGQRYRVWLNGELVNDFFGSRAREGLIGLETADSAAHVAYRNVRVTPLAGGPERLGDAFAASGSPAPIRVLVITATHGFRHTEAIDAAKEVLPELARTTELRFDITDSASAISAENLARYDVLFFCNSTLRAAPADTTAAARAAVRQGQRPPRDPLTAEQQRAIAAFVRGGKGVVLAHAGLDALYGSESYREMVGGGLFEAHPWVKPVHVVVEDRKNPATAHLAENLWIRDEIYILDRSPRAASRVLLSLDTRSAAEPNISAPRPFNPTPNTFRPDHPLSWVRREGEGRVFATVLGHFGDVWHRPDYLQLLVQGIRVAAGRVPADFTPSQSAPRGAGTR
jgi:type 1 glutamine amidotransferase